MASLTVSGLTDILKDIWTDDELNKQFYADTPWLDRLEKTDRYTIGKVAKVPIHEQLGGGDTILDSAGGALNAADPEDVEVAEFGLSYDWRQVSIEFGALNQAGGNETAVVEAKSLEVENKLVASRRSIQRIFLGNGDALIAEATTTTASTTVNLRSTGYGNDAIVRGWLRPGQVIDIGTTANETSVAADRTITSVTESTTAPSIVISGAAVTAANGDYVSIANARSGTTSKEVPGLRSIAGSTTTTVGTLDPATETYWKPASVDTTTAMDTNIPLDLQKAVFQKTGKFPTHVLTSIDQITNLYKLLQNQMRFQGDLVQAGNVMATKWNGMTIEAIPDVPAREFYMLTPEDMLIVTGGYTKPTWASSVQGAKVASIWNSGNTNFTDGLVYACGLGVRRRNSLAANISLTA